MGEQRKAGKTKANKDLWGRATLARHPSGVLPEMSRILTWLVFPRDGRDAMKDPSDTVPSSKRLAGKDKITASA